MELGFQGLVSSQKSDLFYLPQGNLCFLYDRTPQATNRFERLIWRFGGLSLGIISAVPNRSRSKEVSTVVILSGGKLSSTRTIP